MAEMASVELARKHEEFQRGFFVFADQPIIPPIIFGTLLPIFGAGSARRRRSDGRWYASGCRPPRSTASTQSIPDARRCGDVEAPSLTQPA
jgi:hypothetical protein